MEIANYRHSVGAFNGGLKDHIHHYLIYGRVGDKIIDSFEQKVRKKTDFYIKLILDDYETQKKHSF